MTVKELITRSLRLLQVLKPGRTPNIHEVSTGVEILEGMREQMNIDRLWIYRVERQTFTLTANDGTYTMGPGGDFNVDRPVRIDSAGVVLTANTDDPEYPVEVVDINGWRKITHKAQTSDYPSCLYPDYATPLITINLAPVPTVANDLVLYTWAQLQTFDSESTVISGPPGYVDAYAYQLALRMAPEWGVPITAFVDREAEKTMAAVHRHNAPLIEMEMDDTFTFDDRVEFDIRTGRYVH